MEQQKSIAVFGGGISGLSAAWQLQQQMPNARIVLYEASDRLGGFLQTEHVDGYLIETSADMFTTDPATALEFCRKLGRCRWLGGIKTDFAWSAKQRTGNHKDLWAKLATISHEQTNR